MIPPTNSAIGRNIGAKPSPRLSAVARSVVASATGAAMVEARAARWSEESSGIFAAPADSPSAAAGLRRRPGSCRTRPGWRRRRAPRCPGQRCGAVGCVRRTVGDAADPPASEVAPADSLCAESASVPSPPFSAAAPAATCAAPVSSAWSCAAMAAGSAVPSAGQQRGRVGVARRGSCRQVGADLGEQLPRARPPCARRRRPAAPRPRGPRRRVRRPGARREAIGAFCERPRSRRRPARTLPQGGRPGRRVPQRRRAPERHRGTPGRTGAQLRRRVAQRDRSVGRLHQTARAPSRARRAPGRPPARPAVAATASRTCVIADRPSVVPMNELASLYVTSIRALVGASPPADASDVEKSSGIVTAK